MITLPTIADGEDKSSPFINCLRNNYKHLRKWAKRTETDCFRIYEKEIAQYPLAIDFYAGRFCVHYYSTSRMAEEPSEELKIKTDEAIIKVFGCEVGNIYWRTRAKQKETRQYEKINKQKEFFIVHEFGIKFWVNLTDYLDTGLFLDHRETRKLVAAHAKDKKMLNLFAYTCSFSIHAAMSGATLTKSVDMSNTYTDWGKENFLINNLPLKNNLVVRADCLKFLQEENEKYSLIVIDPPTISRSKKMEKMFDVQEDYLFLLKHALRLLSDDGIIFFSTNSRKFQLDETQFPNCRIEEISHKTLPLDFKDKKIHRCWKFSFLKL